MTDYAEKKISSGKKETVGRINRIRRYCIKQYERNTKSGNCSQADQRMKKAATMTISLIVLLVSAFGAMAQSRHNTKGVDFDGTVVTVTAFREDKKPDPIRVGKYIPLRKRHRADEFQF